MDNKTYNLNELAMITNLTTRTLRNHLGMGTLNGEKIDGAWRFTVEDIEAFISNPTVRKSIQANHNALVLDFLADRFKRANRACAILDFAVGNQEAMEISRFFCEQVNQSSDLEMRFSCDHGLARVILSGGEEPVAEALRKYYSR